MFSQHVGVCFCDSLSPLEHFYVLPVTTDYYWVLLPHLSER